MSYRLEIRLAGSGGQGLVLASVILAEAVVEYEGKNAVQNQSYGPEARGGASKSEVIISDEEIDYPKAIKPDILLVMTQTAYDKYAKDLKKDGILIVDEDLVKEIENGNYKLYKVPLVRTASEKIGKAFVANIVALGALVGVKEIVSRESLEKAVLSRVPKGTEDLNRSALNAGFDLIVKK
jgi:2-oxoglutarate ferredoxin oxidoreductase subunit gamma